MKRSLQAVVFALVLAASSLAPAAGHSKAYTDSQDAPDSALDISAAGFGHTKRAIIGVITTYVAFDLQIFEEDANHFFADIKTPKGKFYLVIWYAEEEWQTEVYKVDEGPNTYLGQGAAVSYGDNGIAWAVSRKMIGAKKGARVRWWATTSYRGGTGDCESETCYDYLPDRGSYAHKV